MTLMLTLGASSLAPALVRAFGIEDTEALESPLALAVARQLEQGPWGLYGPYGGKNPLVLIHAPLYYRLAALAAWLIARLAQSPLTAALVAGRLLSSLGFVATLVAAFHLARLGGAPAKAGWWAALLVAATPVFGGLPVAVRPDMLGVALQTIGVLTLLAALRKGNPPEIRLTASFVCFGLAVCIKQQFVVAPAISTTLLLVAWMHGQINWRQLARPPLVALIIVLIDYGLEEWATSGRMSHSVFVAAAGVARIHPADWYFAGNIFLALIWKCVGIILLAAAALVAFMSNAQGRGRRVFTAAGTGLIATTSALTIIQLFVVKMWLSTVIVAGLCLIMCCLIPLAALFEWRSLLGTKVDLALGMFCAGELALAAILCRLSTGAWFNYAIQAVVFGCVLVARTLARSIECAPENGERLATALAVLAVPAFAFTDAREIAAKRAADRAEMARLLTVLERPPGELFFVDRPGDNRLHGRLALVYDPWLYPVFESVGLAEPRSIWLARALESGPIEIVVSDLPRTSIDGISRSLAELGYRRYARVGSFLVWMRGPRG
jgi:hypothetical protein